MINRLSRKRQMTIEMVFVTPGTGVIGRQKPTVAIAMMQITEIAGSRQDIGSGIARIVSKTMLLTQHGPGVRHDLHQPNRGLIGEGAGVSCTLNPHHSPCPGAGDKEALRRFLNIRFERRIGAWFRNVSIYRDFTDICLSSRQSDIQDDHKGEKWHPTG
jgi:hypothetical protein